MTLKTVPIAPLPPQRFAPLLSEERREEFRRSTDRGRQVLDGRSVWNINSTAHGGGVAELLRSLVAYALGSGVDARWAVIRGDPRFYAITKRVHNNLHGSPGDGGGLDDEDGRHYSDVLAANAEELVDMVRPRDIVILHDPQTAGLVHRLHANGNPVVWRCHVGLDMPNRLARDAWQFLIPHVQEADYYVFSRKAFEWEGLDARRMVVIPPTIDAFSPKNEDLTEQQVRGILSASGISDEGEGDPAFHRIDGSRSVVKSRASMVEDRPLRAGEPVVVQVSRWDRLKDPLGVLEGFVEHVAAGHDVHLVLAGPDVEAVADDPEGKAALGEVKAAWERIDPRRRHLVHLASLPMEDGEENAAMVNALQRRADVVVQKSLAEGFGLTVAEAMWKGRPVVASRIGGIQDQVEDGVSGILLDDPRDLSAFGRALCCFLDDPAYARRAGDEARRRVQDHFLGAASLIAYERLCEAITAGAR